MEATEYARQYRAWAIANGILPEDLIRQDEQIANDSPHPSEDQLSKEYFDILRHRRVNFITANDEDAVVTIFTGLKVTKKEAELLSGFDDIDDVSVKYMQGNQAVIKAVSSGPVGVPPCVVHNGRYTCGSSLHPGNTLGAGTLGALVIDAQGVLHGLSNNHVTGLCNFAELDLPVVAPGSIDVAPGNVDPFTLGHHKRLLPLMDGTPNNVNIADNCDAAIFRIRDPALVSSMQRDGYDTPVQTCQMAPGMVVEKQGRSTGHTIGTVQGRTIGPVSIRYSYPAERIVFFADLFVILGQNNGDFVIPGDSGSLITTVHNGDRFACGIVVGANEQNRITYALQIEIVLHKLGINLVGGHNV